MAENRNRRRKSRRRRRGASENGKKMIPAFIAIVFIILIVCVSFGSTIIDKYSYGKDRADLDAYFDISDATDVAIILQNEMIEERAMLSEGTYYVDWDSAQKYFNSRFYMNKDEGIIIYTFPTDLEKIVIGTRELVTGNGSESLSYTPAIYKGETLYIALDYLKRYTNFSYETFTEPNRLQIYTKFEARDTATIVKNTWVRVAGGIKSDILEDMEEGDKVIVLEQMEEWSKVKTMDAMIGYVENKRLSDILPEQMLPVTDYVEPEYTSLTRDYKINMGWHVVASAAGNDTLKEVLEGTKGLNVISPTWFKVSDNAGNFESYATQKYVDQAHDMGLEVWALLENIEYANEIDITSILSSSESRTHLINGLIEEVLTYGIDGINVDLEQIPRDCGEHYIEFIRELSIPCRLNGIVLSIDNYVPTGYTEHYHRKEQGIVADYVIIMGYDEHYAGSDEAGSVASIDFVETGIKMTVEQVPANKVINAVPFYTRIWETKGDSVSSQAVDMATAKEYVRGHNIDVVWDDATCQNYGEYTSGDTLYQVWMEDEDSLEVRLNVMQNYGIGGIAEWRLDFEDHAVWDLIVDYLNR